MKDQGTCRGNFDDRHPQPLETVHRGKGFGNDATERASIPSETSDNYKTCFGELDRK